MVSDALGAFQVTPRGFLGKALGPVVEKQSRPFYDRRNGLRYDMNVFESQGVKLTYNTQVEKLYSQLIKSEANTSMFDFKSKIWEAALDAFGTQHFFSWYRVQQFSPSYGPLHRDFLEDTIYFIATGTRRMRLETWQSLLTMTDTDESVAKEEEKSFVKEFFNLDAQDRPQYREGYDRSLKAVIHQWISQPLGTDDLIFTLRILFGNV